MAHWVQGQHIVCKRITMTSNLKQWRPESSVIGVGSTKNIRKVPEENNVSTANFIFSKTIFFKNKGNG